MFKRHWIIAIALGLSLLIQTHETWSQSASENQPRQQEGAADTNDSGGEQQSQTEQFTFALENIEGAIRNLIAEEDKIEQERRKRQEARDLKAQESMAWWAELMFYATSATVALTAVALFAIVRTLHHTRRAADYTEGMLIEAKETTKAALRTVAVTESIGERQLRPYITYDSGKIEVLNADSGVPEFLRIDISFRNCGLNPGILTAISNADYAPSGKSEWGPHKKSLYPLRVVIGPNQTEKVRFQAVSTDEDGNFSWFTIGVLIWYQSLGGNL